MNIFQKWCIDHVHIRLEKCRRCSYVKPFAEYKKRFKPICFTNLAQPSHNPFGFTTWFAGGGIKPGVSVGSTDEFGYKAVENKYEIHDLHATMLHLLGIEHTESTFRFGGRDMRLTEVYGHLIKEILA